MASAGAMSVHSITLHALIRAMKYTEAPRDQRLISTEAWVRADSLCVSRLGSEACFAEPPVNSIALM